MSARPALLAWVALVALAAGCSVRGDVLRPGSDGGPPVVLHASAVRLSTGQFHSCAVSAGALACWGADGDGRLGVAPGATGAQPPVTVAGVSPWVAPAAGGSHSCALAADGSVWCWGDASLGQLGAGDFTASTSPRRAALPGQAIDVRTGFDHTCALLDDASLWCWGSNREGQLGQADTFPGADQPAPVAVGTDHDWTAVSAGQGHTCGIRAPGALYCWGRNTDGELGQGSTDTIQIRAPVRVGADSDWVEVACGQGNTCARKGDGTLFCWGAVASGGLGLGDVAPRAAPALVPAITDWLSVATNTFHTCGLRSTGEIWCAGRNTEGEIGGADLVDVEPDMLRADPNPGWIEVRAGRFFTCARKADDSVWCMGKNTEGELGADLSVDHSNVALRAL